MSTTRLLMLFGLLLASYSLLLITAYRPLTRTEGVRLSQSKKTVEITTEGERVRGESSFVIRQERCIHITRMGFFLLAALGYVAIFAGFTIALRAMSSSVENALLQPCNPMEVTATHLSHLMVECLAINHQTGALPTNIAALALAKGVSPIDLKDGWNNPIVLLVQPGSFGKAIELVSYGADGRPGGTGSNADFICTVP